MKNLILSSIILMMSIPAFSQQRTLVLSQTKIGTMTCRYIKLIDMDKSDTTYFIFIGYQNERYSSITDIESIAFEEQANLDKFIADLKSALPEMDNKESEVSWSGIGYSIDKHNFSKALYVRNEKGGYTTLNKNKVMELIDWLEKFKIGSDEVK